MEPIDNGGRYHSSPFMSFVFIHCLAAGEETPAVTGDNIPALLPEAI